PLDVGACAKLQTSATHRGGKASALPKRSGNEFGMRLVYSDLREHAAAGRTGLAWNRAILHRARGIWRVLHGRRSGPVRWREAEAALPRFARARKADPLRADGQGVRHI